MRRRGFGGDGGAVPEQQEIIHLGDHVEGIVLAWRNATREERRDMLRLMPDAAYVDLGQQLVVGLKPKPSFLPLFNLKEPVKAGQILLATTLTRGDPDRIRTGDLCLDRAVC